MPNPVDVAVIGGGPAGLAAALYLLRFKRTVLLADSGVSRAREIDLSHNLPGFPGGLGGRELLDRLQQQIHDHGRPARIGSARKVEAAGGLWRILSTDGNSLVARRVLFATGVADRWPDAVGAREALANGILRFCPVCDGFEIRDRRVGVLGNDDHAGEEALFIRSYTSSVTLLSEAVDLSPQMRLRLSAARIQLASIQPASLRFGGQEAKVNHSAGYALEPFALIYAASGIDPCNQLLVPLDVGMTTDGYVCVDAHQQTSRPGLFAAGDLVRGLNQISVALGEASVAATAIHRSLREADELRPRT